MVVKITYFVHGTTYDNERDIATGWLPGELSPLGIEQSIHLGKLVGKKGFDVVFCSDLKRAVDSANLAFSDRYEIIPDRRLREVDFGDFTGLPVSKFKQRILEYVEKPFPKGESYKDVERRVAEFLEFLKQEHDGESVAIVAHQAPQLALEVLLNKKTWAEAFADDWRNTGAWQPGWEYVLE